ncbi:hypothetical protein [Vibrio sp. D431a]|uniref:hypothetical protein n=1 Tax=Vibrio sp. D431a TaxID=2837388 RepID=UPI002552BC19|nr:hypothetical protein [Vibrio sp. D431a]MDK9793895.1 hypothetical protein [Vibrio sp. D431a]
MTNPVGFLYTPKKGMTLRLKGVGDFLIDDDKAAFIKDRVVSNGGACQSVHVSLSNPSQYDFGNPITSLILLNVPEEKVVDVRDLLKTLVSKEQAPKDSPSLSH